MDNNPLRRCGVILPACSAMNCTELRTFTRLVLMSKVERKHQNTGGDEVHPTVDSEASVDEVVEGLRDTAHDAVFVERNVFTAAVGDLRITIMEAVKGHLELGQ